MFHDTRPIAGALLGKAYAFTARPWELKHIDGIDPFDAIGSNISIHVKGTEIMRLLPRPNDELNEDWVPDKVRYSFDGLKRQRLLEPMIRTDDLFEAVTWKKALRTAAAKLNSVPGDKVAAICGKMSEAEGMLALKDLMAKLNGSISQEGDDSFDPALPAQYKFNTSFWDIEDADLILTVGVDNCNDALPFHIRMRRMVMTGATECAYIGPAATHTYNNQHLGITAKTLHEIANGRHPFCSKLKAAARPAIVCGANLFSESEIDSTLAALSKIRKGLPSLVTDEWNGCNVIHYHSGRVGGLELGLKTTPDLSGKEVVYIMGADDVNPKDLEDKFVIFQGSHGDQSAQYADIILPGQSFADKEGIYMNTEGRVQISRKAANAGGLAREDWKIIRALSEVAGKTLPYNTIDELRERMEDVAPALLDAPKGDIPEDAFSSLAWSGFKDFPATSKPYVSPNNKYWQTDSICRSSIIMAGNMEREGYNPFPHPRNEVVQFYG